MLTETLNTVVEAGPVGPPAAPVGLSTAPLARKAMLCSLSLSQWTARKRDKAATDDIHARSGATAQAGAYNKLLIGKGHLEAVAKAVSEARALHYARTLPWLDEGARILPAAAYVDYSAAMRDLRNRFEAAVDGFCADYPAHIQAARTHLGDLFDEMDYPTASQIRRKFGFAVRILPMPDAADFRVGLSQAQEDQLRAEIAQAGTQALDGAMRDAWGRVGAVVGHMVDRLGAYKPAAGEGDKAEGVFRDSLVGNVRELVELLPAFNLTDDPVLTRTVERMRAELCRHDASTLRKSESARQDTAQAAAAILSEISDYL